MLEGFLVRIIAVLSLTFASRGLGQLLATKLTIHFNMLSFPSSMVHNASQSDSMIDGD
jgi:hypothetical protein